MKLHVQKLTSDSGVSILHKLPVILRSNVAYPVTGASDDAYVLPAFQKLINLFWAFDQSGIFDLIQDSELEMLDWASSNLTNVGCFESLQKKLQDVPFEAGSISDVQRADICVTRQWMRVILWRFAVARGLASMLSASDAGSSLSPLHIAKEFLSVISLLPNSALEAHGLGMVSLFVSTYDSAQNLPYSGAQSV